MIEFIRQNHIKLIKNIPVSAGLAGGSTDAAGVLKLMNKIFNGKRADLHSMKASDLCCYIYEFKALLKESVRNFCKTLKIDMEIFFEEFLYTCRS